MWGLKERNWQTFYFSDGTDLAAVENKGEVMRF